MQLRDYQFEAINAVLDYCKENPGKNPLVNIATGGGKSVIIAAFSQHIIKRTTAHRILILTHVKELISQNHDKIITMWPDAPIGIYCAALNRKDISNRIIIGSIQSIYDRIEEFGFFNLVIIDEAHLIGESEDGMYRSLLLALKEVNPNLVVIGLTATPWRMKGGLLTESDDPIFHDIVYDLSINALVDREYLCPLIGKHAVVQADISGIQVKAGEYVMSQVQSVMDNIELTDAAIKELASYAYRRKKWLVFCSTVEHAIHVAERLNHYHIPTVCIHGKLPAAERDDYLARYRAGEYLAVTNVNIMTTGTDIPDIDTIVLLRPTKSAGLMIQIAGRGMRISPNKENCLLLDFAGNLERFGPIDMITAPSKTRKKNGEAPSRICEECRTVNHISAKHCTGCGFVFPIDETYKHSKTASDSLVMANEPIWFDVLDATYNNHKSKKEGSPYSLCVTYFCGVHIFKEWICIDHTGYARQKALSWLDQRIVDLIEEAETITIDYILSNTKCLLLPDRIKVRREGKYDRIIAYDFGVS